MWLSLQSSMRQLQFWYIPILASAMIIMMARPLLIARLLDTEAFASYSFGLLISSTFSMLGCLGLQSLLQRQMPMDLVSGRDTAALLMLFQCVVVAFACVVCAWSVPVSGFEMIGLSSTGIFISLLHGLSQQMFVLATVESRSRAEPLRFSLQNVYRAVLVFSVAGGVAHYSRSASMTLLVEAVFSLAAAGWIISNSLMRTRLGLLAMFQLAFKRFNLIPWSSAFSFLGVMLVSFMLLNVDRWLAASTLSSQDFANYAFAWIILTAAQSVQVIINSSVYPYLARLYARRGVVASFGFVFRLGLSLFAVGLLFTWPVCFFADAVINTWFHRYKPSVELIPLFMGASLLRVTDFWSSYLMIIGKEALLLKVNVIAALGGLILWWVCVTVAMDSFTGFLEVACLAFSLSLVKYVLVLLVSLRFRENK